MHDVASRLAAVRAQISGACVRAGREPRSVSLVAVSKTQPVEAIRAAYAAGQRVFGESYAQELADKVQALADLDIRWRMVGHLQRNKVKLVIGAQAAIDSVDSARLATAIDRQAGTAGRIVPICLQVNVTGEPQKSGVTPEALDALVEHARSLNNIDLRGLMTVPPAGEDPAPVFDTLRTMALRHSLPELSMGMSADLDQAIASGATMVRIGTAIFGPRGPV